MWLNEQSVLTSFELYGAMPSLKTLRKIGSPIFNACHCLAVFSSVPRYIKKSALANKMKIF